MGKAGAPSKSTELLKKQGTYRKDRHGSRVNVSEQLTEEPPEWLNAQEKTVWRKLYPLLQKNGILKETDEVALALLCKTFNRALILGKSFKKPEDFVIEHTSDVGAIVKRQDPKYPILVDAEKNLLKLLTEFGMTPVSRAKVKTAVEEEADPFDTLSNM